MVRSKNENEIIFQSEMHITQIRDVQEGINFLIDERGYDKITLNFYNSEVVFAEFMVPLCSFAKKCIDDNVEFDLIIPKHYKAKSLFINCGWANIISPKKYKEKGYKIDKNIPATVFTEASEQQYIVNSSIDSILCRSRDLLRSDLGALEWSINEICDNVLNHSQSSVGGIFQLNFRNHAQEVEFIVSDAGIGIPDSLRSIHYHEWSDEYALEESIKQGVTRDPEFGQGNGLFGTYQMAALSGGTFHMNSGFAHLVHTRDGTVQVKKDDRKFSGSLVVCAIKFSTPNLLKKALAFKGTDYSMTDFVELYYEQENGSIVFNMSEEAESLGNRRSGLEVRRKINNLLRMSDTKKIYVEMSGVSIMSSSFADEVFGKLHREYGDDIFLTGIIIKNISDTSLMLINKAIRQRKESGF